MVWPSLILSSTITLSSMLVLGLTLFRIPLRSKWPFVLLVSFVISSLDQFLFSRQWIDNFQPMLVIVMQAVFIHYIFRVQRLHALLIAFIGSLCYTLYVAIVFFAVTAFVPLSLSEYYEGFDSAYRGLKIIAAGLTFLTAWVLNQRRLGFTVRIKLNSTGAALSKKDVLLHVFLLGFVLFSSMYYAVSLHLTSIFYFIIVFFLELIAHTTRRINGIRLPITAISTHFIVKCLGA